MVSSLFCRTMILMLQQQQMNQQMQHQQNMSQYLQGPQYPNAPWWTDGAMEYWSPGPAATPAAPAAEGAAPAKGAPAPGGKADTAAPAAGPTAAAPETTPAPAAEADTTGAAPETTPAAPAAEPETTPAAPAAEPAAPTAEGAAAAPDGATWEDDSWLRWCNLCGERSYWRENACLNPHCTVTRQIFVKYVIIIRRCKISCNPFFVMVIVDQGGARSAAIPCIVDSCAAAGICLQRGV